MNLNGIVKAVSDKVVEHLPDILLGLGLGGGVVTTYLACKRTLELSGVLDEIDDDINELHSRRDVYDEMEYPKGAYAKDVVKTYTKSACKVVNLYRDPLAVGATSLALILVGRNVQSNRFHEQAAKLSASVAAGNAAMLSFSNYRANVRDEFGEEVDKRMRFGTEQRVTEEYVLDKNGEVKHDKNGIAKTKKEVVQVVKSEYNPGDSRVIFSAETSTEYDLTNQDYNMNIICSIQNEFNSLFSYHRPYIFMNDAMIELGMRPTKAGQVLGWAYEPGKQINFDVEKVMNPETERWEYVIDFNVDPCILIDKL